MRSRCRSSHTPSRNCSLSAANRSNRSAGAAFPPKLKEHFECCRTGAVVELETESIYAVHMSRLLHRKDCRDLLEADVHVERFGLDVEVFAEVTEVAEGPEGFERCRPIGDDHMNLSERFQGSDQFLPSGSVEFHSKPGGQAANDVRLGNAQLTGQLNGHLAGRFFVLRTNSAAVFI